MCFYCKEVPVCDHERSPCAESRGERRTECGHGSTIFRSYASGRGRPQLVPGGTMAKTEAAKVGNSNAPGAG